MQSREKNRLFGILKWVFFSLCLLCTAVLVATPIRRIMPQSYVPIKMTASVSFVLTAVTAFLSVNGRSPKFKRFGLGIIIAAALSSAGDFAINKVFIVGMALFFISLLTYFATCLITGRPGKRFLITAAVIYIPFITLLIVLPGFELSSLAVPVAIYALTILCFAVKAFDVFGHTSVNAKLFSIGALLFLLSDMVQLVERFYALSPAALTVCDSLDLLLYFPAQALIAVSISEDFLS